MVIKEVKNLKTITMEELLGSLITHEITLEKDKRENEVSKKKKKDLALQLLLAYGNESEGDGDMTVISSIFKEFMTKRAMSYKRFDKKKDVKGNKVLKASIDSEDEHKDIEGVLSEFCFVEIEDVEDEDKYELQQAFEGLYKDSIMLAKKNKELKDMIKTMTKVNKKLKDKVTIIKDLEQIASITRISRIRMSRCLNYLVDLKSSPTCYFIKRAPFAALD